MKYILSFLMLAFSSCISKLSTEPEFNLDLDGYAAGTVEIQESSKLIMNGVYKVLSGNGILGDEVAGKWIGNRWCLYCSHDVVFSENAGGYSRNSGGSVHQIIFTGYIRIVRSGKGVLLNMSVQGDDGADSLFNVVTPKSITLKGSTSDNESIILVRVRDLYKSGNNLQVLAHKGGSDNSARLGRSENSLEMMKYAQVLGATGIEMDVRPTRDRKLIVFHDDTFSPRTVQGAYLLGNVADFDLDQIKLFGTLLDGESIPTLDEALSTIVNSTQLTTVWMDIKDPSIVEDVIISQKKAIDSAVASGRNLKIYLGIPDQNVLDSYLLCEDKNTTPVLIEFSQAKASQVDSCQVWAPRWTIGIPGICPGRKIFVWTLDVRDFISDFLNNSNVDGILTNYPSLVAGMNYLRTQ